MINIPPELLTNARMHYTYLHEHPELSFAEEQTAAYIRRTLDCLQIQYTNAGPTGIIGFLPGRDTSRTIALRADFDALPISEKEDHPLISRNPGIMHACGHDLHTAVLLGTAEILATRSLPFNLMFIFQHGEEVLPGGAGISSEMFFSKPIFRSGSSLYMQNRTFRSASSASVRVNIWPRETRYPSPCTAREDMPPYPTNRQT